MIDKVIARTLAKSLVYKLESENIKYISDYSVFDDPCVYKQRRYGWYHWVDALVESKDHPNSEEIYFDTIQYGISGDYPIQEFIRKSQTKYENMIFLIRDTFLELLKE